MRFIELFAGIGGFRHGLEKANDTVTERTQQGIQQGSRSNSTTIKPFLGTKQFTCVYANEWDKYACQIYRKNFGKGELYEGDIRAVTAKSIPDFDMLVGGFPCQRFSIAGKRKGMSGEDTKGSEFFEVYRIAKERHPQLLLLENVPGLFSSRGGKDFLTILRSLDEIGYDVEWDCINTSAFLPQNRLRVFIIGHLRETGGGKVFPIGEAGKENIIRAEKDIYVIHDKRSCGETRIYKNKSPAVTSTWGMGGGNVPSIEVKMGLYLTKEPMVMDLYNKKNRIECPTLTNPCHNTIRLTQNNRIRRLTPKEAERLQGFPDGWTEGVSGTQRYKCLGNAVTTNVIEEIGRKILKVIK